MGIEKIRRRLHLASTPLTGARRDAQIYLTEATVTLAVSDSGKVCIATRASSTQTFTLPAATTEGLTFTFVCGHASGEINIDDAGADSFAVKAAEDGASVIVAATVGIQNTAGTNILGDRITLVADGVSRWYALDQSGIWATQA